MAQCFDNGIVLLLGLGILGGGLSLIEGDFARLTNGAGAGFWLGVAGLLAFMSLAYRCFFLLFLGTTPGCLLAGTRASIHSDRPLEILAFLAEALQIAVPGLWLADLLLRPLDLRIGLRYSFSYESLPELG